MRENHSELICILDRSGSMSSMKQDAIGGFNSFLDAQKKAEGTADLTLVLFDSEYLVPYQKVALQEVPPLTEKTFIPRGSTALLDAIGKSIDETGLRLAKTPEAQRPEKVIVAILTDGEENASRHYTWAQIHEKIQHQTAVYAWEFVFLAAGQDAIATAGKLAIAQDKAYTFVANGKNMQKSFEVISEEIQYARSKIRYAKLGAQEQAAEERKHNEKMQKHRSEISS